MARDLTVNIQHFNIGFPWINPDYIKMLEENLARAQEALEVLGLLALANRPLNRWGI